MLPRLSVTGPKERKPTRTGDAAAASGPVPRNATTDDAAVLVTARDRARTMERTYRLQKSRSIPSPSHDTAEIDESLREFSDFVQTLGGPQEGLHEENIRDLFTNGIHNKRLPTSPPRIMELDRIPAGLRRTHTVAQRTEHIPWEHVQTSKRGQASPRVRYGAWFIPPAEWRVLQPERAPVLVAESPQARARSNELREQVSTLQGARLFRDYLSQNQTHIPKFLSDCAGPASPAKPPRAASARSG